MHGDPSKAKELDPGLNQGNFIPIPVVPFAVVNECDPNAAKDLEQSYAHHRPMYPAQNFQFDMNQAHSMYTQMLERSEMDRYNMAKKNQKRAANRLSAQLSRQRKKVYFNDLCKEHAFLKRQQKILDNAPDPIFGFNINGSIWYASQSAASQFGMEITDLVKMNFYNLFTSDCSNRLRHIVSKTLKDQPSAKTMLLSERMTVRFHKCFPESEVQVILGELSGKIYRNDANIECICSIRLLSLLYDDHGEAQKAVYAAAATDYNGDQSTGDMEQDVGLGSNNDEVLSNYSTSGSGSQCCQNYSPLVNINNKSLQVVHQTHSIDNQSSDSFSIESSGNDGDDENINGMDFSSSSGSEINTNRSMKRGFQMLSQNEGKTSLQDREQEKIY